MKCGRRTSLPSRVWVLLAACCLVGWVTANPAQQDAQPPVKIGAILPLSGQSAQYGKWIQEGLEMARSEINAHGGLNGRPVKIIYEDDQATPKLAANAMQKLADVDKVPVVFGSWASSSVLAQAPIADRSHVIVMAEAVSPKIRDAGDYIFRIQPDGRLYMRALAPFAFKKLGLRNIAILYVNNDFGADLAAVFRQEFAKLGGKIVFENGFAQGTSDFRSQLTLLANAKPDAVFAPSYAEIGQMLKQAKELGLKLKFLAAATFENPDILAIAKDAAEGVVYPHHFDPSASDERVRAYQKNYQARYGRPSEGFAVLAYEGLHLLAPILRACGAKTDCIKTKLYALENYEGVTGATRFDEMGDVVKPILIKTVRNGEFARFGCD